MNKLRFCFIWLSVVLLVACAAPTQHADFFRGYTARQILAGGEKELNKHNYKEAIRYFEAIDALYPFAAEVQQGQVYTIYSYYQAGENAAAIAAADRYIHMYPVDKHTAYAYYIKGMINLEKNRNWVQKIYTKHAEKYDLASLQEAFVDFDALFKNFPKSIYAKNAEKHMLQIRDLLAKRELQIAQFYFERKAYVAAVNRASYVVQHFEGVPQVLDALRIMIKSYRALGVDKQAEDVLRVLKKNFPQAEV